jgi:hypothetical protein
MDAYMTPDHESPEISCNNVIAPLPKLPKFERVIASIFEPKMYLPETKKQKPTIQKKTTTLAIACILETADKSIPCNVGKYFSNR